MPLASVLTQELLVGDGTEALQDGDAAELKYTGWVFSGGQLAQVIGWELKESVRNQAALKSCNLDCVPVSDCSCPNLHLYLSLLVKTNNDKSKNVEEDNSKLGLEPKLPFAAILNSGLIKSLIKELRIMQWEIVAVFEGELGRYR